MSLFRKIIAGATALAAGAVAACDQAPTSRVVYMRPGGVSAFVDEAVARGPLLVETVQDTFADTRPQAVAEIVAQAVKQGIRGRVVTVTTELAASGAPLMRVRVALDAPADVQAGRALCLGEAPAVDPSGDKMSALMAFCVRGEMEALVHGTIPRPADPTEAAFGKLLTQMSRQIFADTPIGG